MPGKYTPVKYVAVTATTVNGPTNGWLLKRRKLKATGHTIKVGGDVRRIVICGRLSDRGKQEVIRNCLWSNFPLSVDEDKANSLIANNLCRQTGRLVMKNAVHSSDPQQLPQCAHRRVTHQPIGRRIRGSDRSSLARERIFCWGLPEITTSCRKLELEFPICLRRSVRVSPVQYVSHPPGPDP